MLSNYLFWMFMGFILYIFIIFGTNRRPSPYCYFFLPISVFRRKGISNGVQMEWNLRERSFWNKHNPGDLEWTSRSSQGGHEEGGRALDRLEAPPTYFLRLYILPYPENIQEHHGKLFPPPQPSVSARSHLGAFAGAPPEGEWTMEGLYIISKASPMSCE